MANPRNRNFQDLFFFSYLQVFLLLKTSTAFTPADNHLLNCGSATKATVDNRVFLSDSDAGSFRLSAPSSISLQRQHPSPDSSPLYQAARIFTKPSSYEFHITTRGTHFVRLHFSPFSSPKFNLSSAVFSVSAHGLLLLKDFSVSENTDLVKEFLININEEKFDISFTPSCKSSSFAFVNAIEVFSVPKDLILDVARFVDLGKVETFDGLSKQAFETVYRLNIGGDLLTPFNDTLWRTWLSNDEEYLKLQASAKAVSFSGRINYQPGGASREVAPDSVYRTARVMNSANVTKPNFNITWIFPVNLGYQYLVRMHFCDIVSLAVNDLYFDIYINGYSASKDFDLSDVDITNQFLASPYYMDFVVAPKSSGEIHVTIGPSRLSSPSKVNALLNGLEIMKMNNSMGSFDGQFSVDLVLESWPKGHWGIWVLWIVGGFAIMSMLVTGFIMESRRMELKGSVAWSPLPVEVDDNTRFGSSPLSGKLVYY